MLKGDLKTGIRKQMNKNVATRYSRRCAPVGIENASTVELRGGGCGVVYRKGEGGGPASGKHEQTQEW